MVTCPNQRVAKLEQLGKLCDFYCQESDSSIPPHLCSLGPSHTQGHEWPHTFATKDVLVQHDHPDRYIPVKKTKSIGQTMPPHLHPPTKGSIQPLPNVQTRNAQVRWIGGQIHLKSERIWSTCRSNLIGLAQWSDAGGSYIHPFQRSCLVCQTASLPWIETEPPREWQPEKGWYQLQARSLISSINCDANLLDLATIYQYECCRSTLSGWCKFPFQNCPLSYGKPSKYCICAMDHLANNLSDVVFFRLFHEAELWTQPVQPKPGHRNEFVKQFAVLYGRVALLILIICFCPSSPSTSCAFVMRITVSLLLHSNFSSKHVFF